MPAPVPSAAALATAIAMGLGSGLRPSAETGWAGTAEAVPPATLCGRPPEPPLRRTDPRIWELKFESSLWAPGMRVGDSTPIRFTDVQVWFPFMMLSTWNQVEPGSIAAAAWVQGRGLAPATALEQSLEGGMSALRIDIGSVAGQSLRWNVTWREQCWASEVDEVAASRATWPADWPEEAAQWLRPGPWIESDDGYFRAFVEEATRGKLRSVTPWIAAKELVRAAIRRYRSVDSDGIRVESGFPRGIVLDGALASMRRGTGSSHDMAAACVAVLRAAGIPSRFVLGIAEVQMSSGATKPRLVSWCEFWLPGAGWAPFSPIDLRGSVQGGLSLDRPWPAFGTWDDLNRRIPICLGVAPAVGGARSMPYPSGFAWRARGTIDPWQASDAVTLQVQSRGRPRAQ